MRDMSLNLEIIQIKDVCFGSETKIENGKLNVNKDMLIEYLYNPIFKSISVDIAKPGDSVRIIPVKDVIEPRIKADNNEGAFPVFFGKI